VPGNNHGRHQKRNGSRVNGDSSVVKLRFIGVCNGCNLMVEEGGPAPEGGSPWRLGCGCGTAGMWRSPARPEEDEGEWGPVVRERRGVIGLVGRVGGWTAWAGRQAKAGGVGRPAGPRGLNSEEKFFSNKN
jgi:hypothetical protein